MSEDAAKVDRSTALAFERTRVAYERTMMAWIRTATSLITFGFTVYKFFQLEAPERPRDRLLGPRQFGMILISIGLLALALATLEHRQNIRSLDQAYLATKRSLAALVSALIAVLGVIGLLVVLFRQ